MHSAIRISQLTTRILISLLLPVLVLAQTDAVETQRRIRLGPSPATTDPDQWTEWRDAGADEFTWTPPRAFWQGYLKTSKAGQRAGIFVAFLTPRADIKLSSFDQSATSSFAEDGATQSSNSQLEVSGFPADNLVFQAGRGDGLYFTGGRIPTTASVVHVKLEREKTTGLNPFLIFYLACPTSVFDEIEPEFEKFVEATYIQPVYGSVAGRVASRDSGVGISSVNLDLTAAKTNQLYKRAATPDGTYRFDSLAAGSYYLAIEDVPGFRPVPPRTFDLVSGQDTTGVDFALERIPVVATKPAKPTKPLKEENAAPINFEIPAFQAGFGYRQHLNGVSSVVLNARVDNVIPEVGFGCNLWRAGGFSDNDLWATAGLHYLPFHSGSAWFGAGLVWTGSWHNDNHAENSLQLPITVEYFLAPQLSVQASFGPQVTVISAPDSTNSARWLTGPANALGSVGFTWYFGQ